MKKIFTFCILFVTIILHLGASIFHTEDQRYSFLETKQNHYLSSRSFQVSMTSELMQCVQKCLTKQNCRSINYCNHDSRCELLDISVVENNKKDLFQWREGCVVAWWVNLKVRIFTFTTLGETGASGPTSTDGYKATHLNGLVRLHNGIQIWKTPETGKYVIEAFGASGRNGTCSSCSGWTRGGRGAQIKGVFSLQGGLELRILVGQRGKIVSGFSGDLPGSGGGGTFVTLADNTPLLVAGGGGGGGVSTASGGDGDPGQATTNGSHHGGIDGQGGRICATINPPCPLIVVQPYCTGSGFYGNGIVHFATPPSSFVNGGSGGSGTSEGGFGGGGATVASRPGGGGGYSGGGLASSGGSTLSSEGGVAGGGGSYNNGADQKNIAGTNEGDGRVVITLML
ncbi:predicted protein [Nematostella vectensis]|uniref:receptor protein-tyrosine kinase n=1 Tax=Nematostella vectensis TaxID=45351 RepID=A7SM86_NEMVE|nr:predicted protein [Nematostella vectensis]|eukprot:XP_001627290.1 predicted protein [Nematostella vectensis]